jgi:phage FluMu gp28-like protein
MSGATSDLSGVDLLLPYQQRLLASTARVVVYEKSRRIGVSWAAAAAGVLASAASRSAGGTDTLYIGYNLEMARGFIGDCAFWSKALNDVAVTANEFLFDDSDEHGEKAIKAFRIEFASGFEIVALSSRPRSLRGKQGFVILDEAAFHDDFEELMKAALALLIWGGRVWIISTHDGDDNPFNDVVERTRAKKTGFELMRTTFDEALQEGLYRRICLTTGKPWTADGEASWAAEIRKFYGDGAAEELDVIPSAGKGTYFTRAMVKACMSDDLPVLRLVCAPDFEQKPDGERAAFVADWIALHLDPLLERLDSNLLHFFGEDFGRDGDLTVIWPYAQQRNLTKVAPFVVELRRVPFREQEQILFHLVDRLPRFTAGAMDARGNGQYLAEVAMQRYGESRIARIKATEEFYRQEFAALKAAFEDRTILIPADADLLGDHRMVLMQRGVPKIPDSVRRKGTDGYERHGDSAIANLLAHHASELEVQEFAYRTPASLPGARDDRAPERPMTAFTRGKGAW